ncbi:MAG: chorismate mutase [Betaproteobacteria bacterium RIFCSPLOWO2_02_FULL_67_26]|nr:MAG: chorismate mutase [Betaproteobacteria bacterium RIFCSPLOWO2_02_FULL_67_26]
MADKLKQIRSKIDALDRRLLTLVSARARLAQRIGRLKQGTAYRPEREAQVLRGILAGNQGPLPDAALARLFTEIMSACRALEDSLTVAYLGPQGTFSQEAAGKHFGSLAALAPCASIDEVFRKVETGAAGYGVVPVENSTEGAIGRTLDLLLSTPAKVCGEIMLPIRQCLMSRSGRLGDVRQVVSHAQSLAQCQQWLARRLPRAERVTVVSNAEAARLAARDRRTAAIGPRTASALYGLKLIARNIEDEAKNTTRFLVVAEHDAARSGADKTSLIMSTRNVPGAMHELLTPLAVNQVSMTRLESRPSRAGLWEYVFYVDIEGHQQDANVVRALAELKQKASFLKILGSYPAAVT